MTNKTSYSLKGVLLGACSCDWGCPCNFEMPPSRGFCYELPSLSGVQFGVQKKLFSSESNQRFFNSELENSELSDFFDSELRDGYSPFCCSNFATSPVQPV